MMSILTRRFGHWSSSTTDEYGYHPAMQRTFRLTVERSNPSREGRVKELTAYGHFWVVEWIFESIVGIIVIDPLDDRVHVRVVEVGAYKEFDPWVVVADRQSPS